jgi:hypothetical protein
LKRYRIFACSKLQTTQRYIESDGQAMRKIVDVV